MHRLFLGIALPHDIQEVLNFELKDNIPGAKWVLPHQHHLTLLFFGEVSTVELDKIQELSALIKASPFTLSLRGLNFFGPAKSPRLLYLDLEEQPALMALQSKLHKKALEFHFALEKRKFAPHVTLARVKKPSPARIGSFLQTHSLIRFPSFTVSSFHLYKSHLSIEGARYQVLESFLLK